ncbi:hypothetical protein HDA40_008034 [Hamadaea flava]|uniref:Uncharacterized protein n=1 Tax=Hamadaea flava TaxID=1742688 RepID=A0ABV8LUY2_9ACTN|nr:hypothetical protein [Hamadaea flava]MCP2329527.1 hypothetical protein [Hamadaea flava]
MDLTTAYTDAWHRQPDPVERAGDRRPTNEQWVLVAAVWLLAMWSPDQVPGWASTLVPGRTKARQDQQWLEPPPLSEIADVGDLAEVTDAAVLTSRVSIGPGRPYEPARADEEVAAELVALISDVVAARDQRGQALVQFLADKVAGPYSDVLRLTGAEAAPGVPEALHLLHRDTWGSTLRASLTPAAEVQPPPVIAADGTDAGLGTRIACSMTLLSDLLWVNNNTPVTFRFRIGRLDQGAGDWMTTAARWWAENREDADEYDLEEFRAVSATDLRTGLRNEVRLHLIELLDDESGGLDEIPEVPADHLARFLLDDLLDVILTRMGDDVRIACAGLLPVTWPPSEEDDSMATTVLLVTADEVAVLEVDLSD